MGLRVTSFNIMGDFKYKGELLKNGGLDSYAGLREACQKRGGGVFEGGRGVVPQCTLC